MIIKCLKEINEGTNGATLHMNCNVYISGTSGPRVPLREINKKDIEEIINDLKTKLLIRCER